MKYLGNKTRLLPFIESSMKDYGIEFSGTFIDIFSGTASVGYFFKKLGFKVISNDFMTYSYIAQQAKIKLNHEPSFVNVSNNGFTGFANYLLSIDGKEGYFYENFAPSGKYNRQFFSDENAKKIDSIRDELESLLTNNKINKSEYYYILNSLIDSADYVANISGTYGAYLKIWRSMALKKLPLKKSEIYNNHFENFVYQEDANNLIRHIKGDVLYLDPPYNQRQYASNFHVLESLAVWDKQDLYGKSGLRDYTHQKSDYSYKSKAFTSLIDLVINADVKYVILSYNNEGIISIGDIKDFFESLGKYKMYKLDYKRFRTDGLESNRIFKVTNDKVVEHLFILEKHN